MSIPVVVPLGACEAPTSFVSRLAWANLRDPRDFCLDFGMTFSEVVRGSQTALEKVASLGDADLERLASQAIQRPHSRVWTYRGQILAPSSFVRGHQLICPACLGEDIDRSPWLAPHLAAFERGAWSLACAPICRRHQVGLVPIESSNNPHDFTQHIRDSLPNLATLAKQAEQRCPTSFEDYVFERLEGGSASPFLDSMPLCAAARFCEALGAVVLYGPEKAAKSLAASERIASMACGFEHAAGGEDDVFAVLDSLRERNGRRPRRDGPRNILGSLHLCMQANVENPGYAVPRDTMRRYVIDRFPLPAGSDVYGTKLAERVRHSIHSLALETGMHPQTTRRRLLAANIIPATAATWSDHSVVFDAEAGLEAVVDANQRLTWEGALRYLNITRPQFSLLLRNGYIKPVPDPSGLMRAIYRKEDLEGFLAKLSAGAEKVASAPSGTKDIPEAARAAHCSASVIIDLVLRQAIRTFRLARTQGYRGVLVDVEEIKRLTWVTDNDHLPVYKAAVELSVSTRVIEGLISVGALPAATNINAITRRRQTLIAKSDLRRFAKAYVSLTEIAEKRRTWPPIIVREMQKRGIPPCFDADAVKATFYPRRSVGKNSRSYHKPL